MVISSALRALVVVNLLAGAWSFAVDGVTPSWVVYPLLLLLGMALLRRSRQAAAAYVASLAALFTLVHLGFVSAALSQTCVHPADPGLACHRVTWLVTLGALPAATAVAAALLWVRGRRSTAQPA